MFSFMTKTIFLLLLFFMFKSYGSSTDCSRNCRCSVCPMAHLGNLTEMTCNSSSLKEIKVSRNICSLVLSGSKISTLDKKVLQSLNGILSLDLSFNSITRLPRRVFFGVETLQILYLKRNLIYLIHRDGLTWMKQLKYLDMSFNLITKLPEKVFNGLRSMRTLNISYNAIQAISGNMTFRGLSSLIELDLSHNGLENLTDNMFRGLPSMTYLNLKNNNITTIQTKAFFGLRELKIIDLSYNNIVSLSYSVFNIRRNLQHVNLDGNNVTEWLGSPSNNTAMALSLSDKKNTQTGQINRRQIGQANNTQLQYTPQTTKGCFDIRQKPVIRQVLRNKTRCLSDQLQDCVVIVNRTKIVTTRFNICWDIINKLRPMLFTLGAIGVLTNITVFGTVMGVKNLRKCLPFLLVSHMALCDTLVGIYSFGIAFGHEENHLEFDAWKEIYCPAFRSIFIMAEVAGSLTSLLMTAERYLAIVFCMKPGIRLGRKTIAAALALFWITGAASATLVQLLDKRNNQKEGQMCLINRNSDKKSTVFVSELILLFLVFAYLVVVALYIHIFIVVRRSARSLGVLRESKLAKRISAIVLSSFVFFAAPNCITAWFIFNGGGVFEDARLNRTLLWWLPPVCLVANACLDPCLFAFRNDKFVKGLKRMTTQLLGRTHKKKNPARRDPCTVFSSLDTLASSRFDLSRSIELTLFTAAENSEA